MNTQIIFLYLFQQNDIIKASWYHHQQSYDGILQIFNASFANIYICIALYKLQ